jgi:hypothetical protein
MSSNDNCRTFYQKAFPSQPIVDGVHGLVLFLAAPAQTQPVIYNHRPFYLKTISPSIILRASIASNDMYERVALARSLTS